MFLCFLYSDKALSATKYMYVGETCQIETPSAVSDNGYIDNAAVIQSDSHISVDVSDILNVKVTVIDYFEYTATVTVRFVEKYTYNGRVNKIDHDVSLQIKAMYPTITMLDGKKTASVSVSVGGTAKLEYKVEPSGLLAPPMYFGFSPFDSSYHIEKVSEDYNQNTGIGYLKVKGLSAGSNMIIALPYGNQTLNLIWEVTVGNSNKIELIATPPGGEVAKGTVVYLSTPNVTGASIYYTLDGTYPTQEFDPLYTSSGITINEDCTLRAIAYKNGYNHSDVLEEKYTIKSSDIEPTSIDVSPSSKTINVGDTFYCDYTLTPSNATTTVTWYSDNDNIASVNSSGKVTGVSAGTTYINAKTANGKEDWCKVTVESNPIPPTDIDVSPSYKTIKVGDTFYCDYTLTPSNATTTVTWYSDNSSVASVNSSGKVTGVSAGTTYINAKTANGKEDWCKVTVESNPIPPTDIDVSPSYKTIKVGETFYCDYTLTPSNATTTVTWYSDNSSVASVNSSGKVTGVSVGTTYINAKTANGKEDWCKVTVESNPIPPTDIGVSPSYKTIKVGETFYCNYTLTPSNATTTVTWYSDNSSVASVNSSGKVTGVSVGTTYINAKTANGKEDWCKVTVESENLPIMQMSAGEEHSMILKTNGTLWGFGCGGGGRLGDGTTTSYYIPKQVMTDVAAVSAGLAYTMILKTDGSLWACGDDSYGGLGTGNPWWQPYQITPKLIMTDVESVSAGRHHSMILKTDGTLWACGYNKYGQLGDGTTTNRDTPVKVMDGVASVSAGNTHTMILKTDGSLWACGENDLGQLCDGTTTSCYIPKKVMIGNVAAVSSGAGYTMILKTDGTLWACGNNNYGQLGDGTTTNCSTPKQVMSNVATVSTHGLHTMILKNDGTLWACGNNRSGQLGDGTTVDRSSPKQVMTGVAAVSTGVDHSIILKTDGTLWTCGYNHDGQLGDGTTIHRYTPVMIMGGTSDIQPAAVGEGQQGCKGVYNLHGQKVDKPVKGLYIVNGRKVLIK